MSVEHLLKAPMELKKGLMMLIYGGHSTKKTLLGLTFPESLIIDSEAGTNYYQGDEVGKNIKLVAPTRSFYDLIDLLEDLIETHEERGVKTVVVDSLTNFKTNMEGVILTIDEKRAREDGKDENEAAISQRSWGRIKNINDRIVGLLLDLASRGVNIVTVARLRDDTEMRGTKSVVIGVRPDAQKKIEHEYDVVLRNYTKVGKSGEEYFGLVEKDRTHTFEKGTEVKEPCYEMWKKAAERGDKLAETSFTSQMKDSNERYVSETENDNKPIKDLMVELTSKLTAEQYENLKADLKAGAITKFDGLTVAKEKKLRQIYDKFSLLTK